MGTRERAAFFDVDETLLNTKSMFAFLGYWMALHGDDGTGHAAIMAEVRAQAAAGVPRTEINRRYYRRFAGVAQEELARAGADWYADYRRGRSAVVVAAWAAADRHARSGDLVALVSGSFRAVLEPLARDVGADLILCSEPLVGPDGRLTGEIRRPMIGSVKADAVRETVAELGLDPAVCSCYGDHSSDLDMLLSVGDPVVVGADPVLLERAQTLDWAVLSAAPGPLRGVPRTPAEPVRPTGRASARPTDADPVRPAGTEPVHPAAAESVRPTGAGTESLRPTGAGAESVRPTGACAEQVRPTGTAVGQQPSDRAALTRPRGRAERRGR